MPFSHDETVTPSVLEGDRLPSIDLKRDAILLDVDGTLVDIAPTPEEVRVPAGLRQILSRLIAQTDGALALVSGRRLDSIDALFAPLLTAAIGCHGAQMRSSPGVSDTVLMPALPKEIRLAYSDIALLEPRIRIEDKTFMLAFHYRQAADREIRLRALLQERLAPFTPDVKSIGGSGLSAVSEKSMLIPGQAPR